MFSTPLRACCGEFESWEQTVMTGATSLDESRINRQQSQQSSPQHTFLNPHVKSLHLLIANIILSYYVTKTTNYIIQTIEHKLLSVLIRFIAEKEFYKTGKMLRITQYVDAIRWRCNSMGECQSIVPVQRSSSWNVNAYFIFRWNKIVNPCGFMFEDSTKR